MYMCGLDMSDVYRRGMAWHGIVLVWYGMVCNVM